ncbi:MAG: hypothetical protein ACJ8BC_18920 [Gemmatimonadales bacterium]
MTEPPTNDQIHAALQRAADKVKPRTTDPDRLLRIPNHQPDPHGERWWLIGWVPVLGESDRWEVLYDPVIDQGRLRAKRSAR